MKLKLSAETIWTVKKEDEEMAKKMLDEKPVEAVVDYLSDAIYGDPSFGPVTAHIEVIEQ